MYGIYTMCINDCGTFAQLMSEDGPVRFDTIKEAETFVKTMGITDDISILESGYVSESTHTAH